MPGGRNNTAAGDFSFAAGYRANANHNGSFVWADSTNADLASTANDQFMVRASGGVTLSVTEGALRLVPRQSSPNVIGGYSGNSVSSVSGATIGGGGNSSIGINQVTAFAHYATIGGGLNNTAGASLATIGGGSGNTASGSIATVGGGTDNTASGDRATIPGGEGNTADGYFSFAAGRRAQANNYGAFVWADANDFDFASTANYEFSARATGGVRFVSAIDGSGTPTAGVILNAGAGSWSNLSDRNLKENFAPVDAQEVLAHLAEIPITTWNYRSQDPAIRHIGPMAQDFYAALGMGEDDKHISTMDADGVALTAVQGLYQVVQAQDARIETLEAENGALQRRLDSLEARVAALEGQDRASVAWPGGWSSVGLLVSGLLVGLVVVGRKGMLGQSPGGE